MKLGWVVFSPLQRESGALTSRLASLRYRMLIPARALRASGYESNVVLAGGPDSPEASYQEAGADVLIVTKLLPGQQDKLAFVREMAALARAHGKRVVVDICDDHFGFEYFRALSRLGDLVTAPTAEMADTVRKHSERPCVVIPDPYEGPRGVPRVDRERWAKGKLRLLWFGFRNNLPALFELLPRLAATGLRSELQIVSDGGSDIAADCERWNRQGGDTLQLHSAPWSPQAMQEAFEACDAVLLPSSPGDPQKRVKSANRLVESLRAGRFPIAAALPSYLEFAPYGCIGDDLGEGLRRLLAAPEEALAKIVAGQAFIEARYSPEAVAKRWDETLRRLVAG